MADAYFMMQDTLLARQYKERQILINDSIYDRHQFNKVKNVILDYEKKNIDERISLLNHKISLQTAIIVCFVVVLVLTFIFLFYIYRSRKKLRAAHSLLIDKIRELNRIHHNPEPTKLSESDDLSMKLECSTENSTENPISVKLSQEQIDNICRDIDNVMNNVEVISDSGFSVSQLATMVNSNSGYISNVINNVYGKNFKTLLNEHRINEACRRMADTDTYGNLTIRAIYEDLGYRSASNFIKAFRAVTSMTPSEYLKLIKTK